MITSDELLQAIGSVADITDLSEDLLEGDAHGAANKDPWHSLDLDHALRVIGGEDLTSDSQSSVGSGEPMAIDEGDGSAPPPIESYSQFPVDAASTHTQHATMPWQGILPSHDLIDHRLPAATHHDDPVLNAAREAQILAMASWQPKSRMQGVAPNLPLAAPHPVAAVAAAAQALPRANASSMSMPVATAKMLADGLVQVQSQLTAATVPAATAVPPMPAATAASPMAAARRCRRCRPRRRCRRCRRRCRHGGGDGGAADGGGDGGATDGGGRVVVAGGALPSAPAVMPTSAGMPLATATQSPMQHHVAVARAQPAPFPPPTVMQPPQAPPTVTMSASTGAGPPGPPLPSLPGASLGASPRPSLLQAAFLPSLSDVPPTTGERHSSASSSANPSPSSNPPASPSLGQRPAPSGWGKSVRNHRGLPHAMAAPYHTAPPTYRRVDPSAVASASASFGSGHQFVRRRAKNGPVSATSLIASLPLGLSDRPKVGGGGASGCLPTG